MCDLHLPFEERAVQYDVLDWAKSQIEKDKPDCIVFAGDFTADGNLAVYEKVLSKFNRIGIPFLYIPGNSDLRTVDTRAHIKNLASDCLTVVDGIQIFAINDSDGSISETQLELLESANERSIVFMHHPICCIKQSQREKFLQWKNTHKGARVFFAHEHYFEERDEWVSLPAMDPDKAIDEKPCIAYYDTNTKSFQKVYYPCDLPTDLPTHFGISCYYPETDIAFALEKGLKNLELRPNIVKADEEKIVALIDKWRLLGDTNLSIHLSEVSYQDGNVVVDETYPRLIALGKRLKAERFTQHVPLVSVATIRENAQVLEDICAYVANALSTVDYPCVIGVENMHMTKSECANDERRFGYTPEETLSFMNGLRQKMQHIVGVNFDIGHARNNAPYSQKYPIGTWLAMLGKDIVGYHLHQVTEQGGQFENHMPITKPYGRLISFASFFRCWQDERIAHCPVIFEMRPKNAYAITIDAFEGFNKMS